MYRYKRLFVGLDLTEKDASQIAYSSLISRMARSEEIVFCHVRKELDLPLELKHDFPELYGEPLEDLQIRLKNEVDEIFAGDDRTKIRCEVLEGSILHEMLRFIKDLDVDLTIVGQQSETDTTSKIAEKLTRKAPCSVLILPVHTRAKISKILVPVEFSGTCAQALETAAAFGLAAGLQEITCAHIYKLPQGYYKTGKTKEQFQEIMEKNARKAFAEFIKDIDLRGLTVNPVFRLHNNTVQGVRETIAEQGADLAVLGAHGRTAGASMLLGSVTEGLIRKAHVPILAVKQKGTGMNILETIMKM
ncbi:MAG: universal stress protein [Desulfohalobiaceae bacterium]|nr:universal stress protein [Desulfohalobiaceae bacterium]